MARSNPTLLSKLIHLLAQPTSEELRRPLDHLHPVSLNLVQVLSEVEVSLTNLCFPRT